MAPGIGQTVTSRSLKKYLTPAIVLLSAGLISACVSTISKQSGTGQFDAIAEGSDSSNLADYPYYDHYQICEALYHLQEFTRLDECLRELWKRSKSEELAVTIVAFDENYTELMFSSLEAQRYLDLGDVDQARIYAERVLKASERAPRLVYNELLSAYTTIFTLGLNNPNAEDGPRADSDRIATQSEGHGLMAIVEELSGNKAKAEQHRSVLKALYREAPKIDENAYQTAKARFWLSRASYAAEDYTTAYNTLTQDARTSGEKALLALAAPFLLVGKPLSEPISLAVIGATTDEVAYYQTLPAQVILSRSAFKTGKHEIAAKSYDQLLANPRIANYSNLYFRLLHERALIEKSLGNEAEAEKLLIKAVAVLEDQRASIDSEDYRMGFVGDKVDVYGDLVELLVARLKNEDAFEYSERAKARALVDMLASRSDFATPEQSNGAELVRLLDKLEEESKQRTQQNSSETGVRSAKRTALKQQLKASAPELASLVTVGEIDRQEIQSLLEPDEVLLEYYGFKDTLFAFVVTRQHVDTVRLDGNELALHVAETRETIAASKSRAFVRSTRRMYDRLIRPLEDRLNGKTLTIVPHGPLHYLPFAALNDGDNYLIDKFDIRLLPSASVLQFLDKTIQAEQDLLALGNPDLNDPESDLPGAERETRVIDQGRTGSRILLRELASEANFKKFAPSFRYLHLASHGEFNNDFPLQSRMLLAPGDNEDGNLTVDELYTLRLNAELVTLSACETGLGDITSGDDVVGLTRGFMYAGAKSIVASLWPVADNATAYLMQEFYRNLRTMPKAAALRLALIKTKDEFDHPIYWSAFNLTGVLR